MKIVLINTYDIQGGAARAAFRLHKGLLQRGADSRMLVQQKFSKEDSVRQIQCDAGGMNDDEVYYINAVQKHYINNNRTDISNTLFSLPYPGYDLSTLPSVRDADVINLHWVAYYESPLTLHKLFVLGKPVIWTLHDQWAFTGGCHYAAGCQQYARDCSSCPQLAEDPFNLPSEVLKDKRELFKGANLTIVTPSRWLQQCAKESSLFRDLRCEVIANSLETDQFIHVPKREAKRRMNIPEGTIVLLAGAESNTEKRKGFQKLSAALQHCKTDARFRRLMDEGNIAIMSFGHSGSDLDDIGLPVISVGYVDSDQRLRDIYAAADVFILPSLEDNLPNTMLESLSCGTPVVAFDIGGMPDVITHGVNGCIIPAFNTENMADAVLDLVFNPDKREQMGRTGSKTIASRYSLDVQAEQYQVLCAKLLLEAPSHRNSEDRVSFTEERGVEKNGSPEHRVPCSASTGPFLQKVFSNIALKSLKRGIEDLQQRSQRDLKASEDDRYHLGQQVAALQRQLKQETITHQVELNAKRVAIDALQEQLQQEIDALRQEKDALRQQLQSSESDRIEKANLISDLQYQNYILQTFDGAITVVSKKILKKIGLLDVATHYKTIPQRGYRFIRKLAISTSREIQDTASEANQSDVPSAIDRTEGSHDINQELISNSPVIEALVAARSVPGNLNEQAMMDFAELGSRLRGVLCIDPDDTIIQAAAMMAHAGANVTCLNGNYDRSSAKACGLTLYDGGIYHWMVGTASTSLTDYDCVILNGPEMTEQINFIKGRVWPNTKIIFRRSSSGIEPLGKAFDITVGEFGIYNTPPESWLDSTPKEIAFYQFQFWPLKDPLIKIPSKIASGRAWPKISVVTVSYNQGAYLEETIRSVLLQGYPNLEYIVIDGGSNDNTATILNRYRGELTHCISEPDKGQSDALNKGFRLATGEILAWLNSDDRYLPGTLWRVAQAFDSHHADIVAGGCALVQGDEKTPFRIHHNSLSMDKVVPLPLDRLLDIDGSWQKGDFFYQPEVFWSRAIWEKSGARVDEQLFYSMDYELWLRMARSGAMILHIPDTLALFRMHERQKTSGEAPFLPELRQVNAAFKKTLHEG